jgi:hypothetical protein
MVEQNESALRPFADMEADIDFRRYGPSRMWWDEATLLAELHSARTRAGV